jgi:hypothetical protein
MRGLEISARCRFTSCSEVWFGVHCWWQKSTIVRLKLDILLPKIVRRTPGSCSIYKPLDLPSGSLNEELGLPNLGDLTICLPREFSFDPVLRRVA